MCTVHDSLKEQTAHCLLWQCTMFPFSLLFSLFNQLKVKHVEFTGCWSFFIKCCLLTTGSCVQCCLLQYYFKLRLLFINYTKREGCLGIPINIHSVMSIIMWLLSENMFLEIFANYLKNRIHKMCLRLCHLTFWSGPSCCCVYLRTWLPTFNCGKQNKMFWKTQIFAYKNPHLAVHVKIKTKPHVCVVVLHDKIVEKSSLKNF